MLRDVTMAVFLGAASHVAVASVAYAPNAPAIIPVPYVVDTNISYGQSWEDNTFVIIAFAHANSSTRASSTFEGGPP
jgi:hypothetical protein